MSQKQNAEIRLQPVLASGATGRQFQYQVA
jgi:hypothetical protein